jgi:hypothetical protein
VALPVFYWLMYRLFFLCSNDSLHEVSFINVLEFPSDFFVCLLFLFDELLILLRLILILRKNLSASRKMGKRFTSGMFGLPLKR